MPRQDINGFFDAHAHLQDERLAASLSGLMDRAREAGVKKVVCCGTKEDDWEAVRRLKHDYPDMVIASFGLHPWYIKERSPDWLRRLEGFLLEVPSGVGEFGLDFAIEGFDTIEQKDVFTQQLSLAKRLKRPVSIHCRKAWDTLIDILGNFGQLSAAGLVHSYSGGPGFIPSLTEAGLSVSFSGSVTYSRNKRGRASAQTVPADRLLIETDSPDILPAGAEGLTEPSHVTEVAAAVAGLRGRDVKEIAAMTMENGLRVFGHAAL